MNVLLKAHKVKCIITAIDLEFLAVIKQFNIHHEHIYKVNDECIIAECIDRKLVIAQAGIGKTKANECAEVLYKNYPYIRGFLSIGLAGALSDQLLIGDIVIGDSIIDKEQDTYKRIEFFDTTILPKLKNDNVKCGPILCSDEFINDTKTKQYLFNEYGTICVEMESSGIVNFTKENDFSFLVIKAISDHANEKAIKSIIRSYKTACNSLALYLNIIIDDIFCY